MSGSWKMRKVADCWRKKRHVPFCFFTIFPPCQYDEEKYGQKLQVLLFLVFRSYIGNAMLCLSFWLSPFYKQVFTCRCTIVAAEYFFYFTHPIVGKERLLVHLNICYQMVKVINDSNKIASSYSLENTEKLGGAFHCILLLSAFPRFSGLA
mgnify:CR=1 FL=1